MSPVLDRAALATPPTIAEQLVGELRLVNQQLMEQRTVLTAVLAELQSWRTAAPTGCAHPEALQENLSSMGDTWIRCRGCGADLVRKERRS